MATPQTMKALKVTGPGKVQVQDVPVPEPKDDWILVKVNHVALNPTDWKHIDYVPVTGTTVGCDYAGTVVKPGPNVKGDWKAGDRIAGLVHGCNQFNHEDGAFAEYTLAREGAQMRIPSSLSDAEAATLGVAISTVGFSLYDDMSLPWPGSVAADEWVLIYGGSTATGSIAVQFAKLSGARVIATSSTKNHDFVRSLGAEQVFDYHDPDCAEKIREYTKDELCYVYDCFGGDAGAAICAHSISSRGGLICSIIAQQKYPRPDEVRAKAMLTYKICGERWALTEAQPATFEDYKFGTMFWRLATKLVAEGKIQVHPPRVGKGLEGVIEGLDEMRKGTVSATKLVYQI